MTFLFTDIEGSTRLLTRLGGGYADLLGEHRRLLRAAFNAYDGREVHTTGDAFFVAFARASDAIAAAVAAQRALASRSWLEGVDVRVRMGIHTGEATIAQDDYIGLDVHRAARICSAGHGGQVLISSSTRELVAGELPADVALTDLGEHRLKDLDRAEHLFQVLADDLQQDSPALRLAVARLARRDRAAASAERTIGPDDHGRVIAAASAPAACGRSHGADPGDVDRCDPIAASTTVAPSTTARRPDRLAHRIPRAGVVSSDTRRWP